MCTLFNVRAMKLLAIILLLVVSLSSHSSAVEPVECPSTVAAGFEAYQTYGLTAAMEAWLKASPLESDTPGKNAIQAALSQVAPSYGRMLGYELLKTYSLSPSVRRAYAIVLHEKGPVYVSFECYQTALGWVISQMAADRKAESILPSSLLDPEQVIRIGHAEKVRGK